MATTLGNMNTLVNDRRRDSSSSTLDMTAEGFRAINGTLELWQMLHDWPWTIEKQEITYHKGVDVYSLNSDFKADIDLSYKKASHGRTAEFHKVSPNSFHSEQQKIKRYAIQDIAQDRRIMINATGNKVSVNNATSYDGDGTWVAAGDASNISTDTNEFFDLTGSINFDYNGTSGTLTVSDMSAKDLSDYVDRSAVYMNIFLPTVSNFTSVTIRIGSDSSNYYTASATTDHIGDSVVTGWNKLKFNVWDTSVGSPDAENIDYIQITLAYGSTANDTDFRIENIFVSEDIPLILEYYSLNMVKDAGDDTKRAIFDDSAATTDTFLWSSSWDYVKEPFLNSVLEIALYLTGEYGDRSLMEENVNKYLQPLRQRLPSRRRQTELQFEIDR